MLKALLRMLPAALLAACSSAAMEPDNGGSSNPDAGPTPGAPDAAAEVEPADLDTLLEGLRSDATGTLLSQSHEGGWPAEVEGGYLFVTTDVNLTLLAGDHDNWQGQQMTIDQGFNWLVLDVAEGSRYKFTDGQNAWVADPFSRAYEYDNEGLMSRLPPSAAHLERFFAVGDDNMAARTIRVWVPESAPSHLLYMHDGQNLFDPNAIMGGWKVDQSAPGGLMVVGIDNTESRFDEYTHVEDDIGAVVGGKGDEYADFVHNTVRDLVRKHYGEPDKLGVMGSSLGGLISLHIADRFPGEYVFAGSLSGSLGWGSRRMDNETMIERYAAAGHRDTAIYIDSGGNATACVDSDGDGVEDDDATASDNYCENRQMEALLVSMGYEYDVDFWHWWEPDAPHNEIAWAARVFRPLGYFVSL